MLHRGPQLPGDLSGRFDRLMIEYEQQKGKSVNAEREKFIKLVQSFHEDADKSYDHYAALGICVHGLMKIGGFSLFTAPKKKSYYQFFGSELGELLQNILSISYGNPLDDQQALTYLTATYHHLKKYPRNLDGMFGENKESEDLIKDIEKNIKLLLEQLATKRPTYNALLHNFSEIEKKYNDLGGSDVSRKQYILFTQLLNTDLCDRYQHEAKEDREWTDAYSIRYAAMLNVLEEIESEHTYFSPDGGPLNKGSALYKACKQAVNINKNTTEVSQAYKCNYYVALLSYVVRVLSQPHELEKWGKKGLTDSRVFFEKLRNKLAEKAVDLMRVTKPGRMTSSYMDFVISYAAGYGVSIALGRIAAEMSVRGTAMTYVTLLRPEAALLITLLTYATKSIVSKKATGAVKTLLVTTVSQPILITFNSAVNLGEFCYGLFISDKGVKPMEVIDNDDFMKALSSLPETVWTPVLKEKMKYVTAYGRDETLPEKEVVEDVHRVLKMI